MTNRELKKALLEKLAITPRGLSHQAKKIKAEQWPLTTEDAVYLIAAQVGLDLYKYLDSATVDRIRQLRQGGQITPPPQPSRRRTPSVTKTITVTIAKDIRLKDPLLPKRILDEAKLMADRVYPLLYVLENSIRELIRRVLERAHGKDWWTVAAPSDVKKEVQKRRPKEDEAPWHGRRGAHEIFYTDLGHLRSIVTSNQNWPHFEPILPSQGWLTQRLGEIEMSRNVIAHCNPLRQRDIDRLKLYLGDWQSQIEAVRHLIPQ